MCCCAPYRSGLSPSKQQQFHHCQIVPYHLGKTVEIKVTGECWWRLVFSVCAIVPVARLHHIRKRPLDTVFLLSLCLKHKRSQWYPVFQWEKVMFCLQNKSQWFYLAHLTSMTYQVIFPKETTYSTF